jgi:hypothetical protein
VYGLKWKWEIAHSELGVSVFDTPRENAKGRKCGRVLVDELVEALGCITNEGSRVNRSFGTIRRKQLGEKSHPKVTIERKMG